jgi:mono/diheme cytochrome c family protein
MAWRTLWLVAAVLALSVTPWLRAAADEAAVKRGGYLLKAAGCEGCHTDVKNSGPPLAGGRALATPFGTFYGPNITPDPDTGIGRWSAEDFRRALREGKDEHGRFMFPVFPFPSFTGMTDADIDDLYAYLMAQPHVVRRNRRHEIKFPFGFRPLLVVWRALFFRAGPLVPVAGQPPEWNRGRYLAEALAHCEECHTPRNFLGALDRDRAYAGNPDGPDGQKAPNITSDEKTGIGKWSLGELETLLTSGETPDHQDIGGGMGEVVNATSALTAADRHSIAVYIKSLPPLRATGK